MQVQSTFQYVSILSQLKMLFANRAFCDIYIQHNNGSHECVDGVYVSGCCASMCKTNSFFQRYPSAIQIQLYMDEFEPCDPLKSKAGIHKTTAFYFRIKNLPRQFLSRINCVYLVALCNSNDLKNDYVSINNIFDVIVNELKALEKHGIETALQTTLKGGLFSMMFDNLGANMCLGMVESFNAKHYCRFCIKKKDECQVINVEDEMSMRTRNQYEEIISMIEKCELTDQTFGIKSPCALNQLESFHILTNPSVDLMHDLLEGIVPFTLEQFFVSIISKKILSQSELEDRILMFPYSAKFRKNAPRKIHLKKKNLNLSAAQAHCLFLHVPFIFYGYRDEIAILWTPVQSLLRILQILFSNTINESDLCSLTRLIRAHLDSVRQIFNVSLIPKHHLLTHYPSTIRKMGPVIHNWSMRMEQYHQNFKNIVRKAQNFININKTMAERHQENISVCSHPFSGVDEWSSGIIRHDICLQQSFHEYIDALEAIYGDINTVECMKTFEFNGVSYGNGRLIRVNNQFVEIAHILNIHNKFIFLSNRSYVADTFEMFFNSLCLSDSSDSIQLIQLDELQDKNCYDICLFKNKMYVIVESLDVHAIIENI